MSQGYETNIKVKHGFEEDEIRPILTYYESIKNAKCTGRHAHPWIQIITCGRGVMEGFSFYKMEHLGPGELLITMRYPGTSNQVYWRFRLGKLELLPHRTMDLGDNAPIFTTFDRQGNLYTFVQGKLKKYDSNGQFIMEISTHKMESTPIYASSFTGICHDLTFLTSSSIYTLKEGVDTLQPHPVNRYLSSFDLYKFLIKENGDIWLAGGDRQLFFYDVDKDKLYDYRDQLEEVMTHANELFGLFMDKTGILWVSLLPIISTPSGSNEPKSFWKPPI